MRHQQQINRSTGCGVACIAMLAGVTQEYAAQVMFGDNRRNLRSHWPDLRRALKELSILHADRPLRKTRWDAIDKISLVACGLRLKPDGTREWHWVIFDPKNGLVYDPFRNHPISFKSLRRRPFSYLPVEPK